MGSAEWLRMYAQRLEDEHAPYNLSIGMREAADQMDQQRETTLQFLGQVGQLSDELERTKREAERAQDAYGVRFLNYLEETARLTDEIECLKAELRTASDMNAVYEGRLQEKEADNESLRLALEVAANDLDDWGAYTKAKNARAALEGE